MAPKKECRSRKGKMVPSKDDIPCPASPIVDGRLKFSDRLKALLKSGGTLKDDAETEDPYAFSEPEPQVLRLHQKSNNNNCFPPKKATALTSRHCQVAPRTSKVVAQETGDATSHIYGINMARLYPALAADNVVLDSKVSDDESSKTMNRLQAKIAQSKVIGKHKKVHSSSPSPELISARKRERSLLEEQLLGLNADMPVKKEPPSSPVTFKSHLNNSSHSVVVMLPPTRRRSKTTSKKSEGAHHESLQRLQAAQDARRDYKQDLYPLGVEASESEESDLDEETGIFQRHWFFNCGEQSACGDGQREGRLTQMRTEMRRKLGQMWGGMPLQHSDMLVGALIQSARTHPSQTALLLRSQGQRCGRQNRSKLTMLVKRVCSYRKGESDACSNLALPCTQHCVRHIMYNVDQLLFEHCTAKFSDNTQCCVPVFDICHELPLCLEHARKRDNYDRMCAETKPKKIRKKAKPSAMTRPSKRGKKKRRLQRLSEQVPVEDSLSQHLDVNSSDINGGENSSPSDGFEPYIKEEVVENSTTPEPQPVIEQEQPDVQVVEEEVVLGMSEELPLDPVELANQATRLLEEHDLTNVLNQIPEDAFNDLFTEDKNGEYEPTREETEELERALEAVDKDVKSLEKLSQTQGLLDTLMDDHTLVQTLSQLPEVPALTVPGIVPVFTSYHNGFVVNSHTSAPVDSKSLSHSSESPPILTHPTISIQTQTDLPS
ncbi:INO80 complex subunit D isoform X2 [Anabrus simplex]|uniref:INO80 complex subunit D isoform X2 n=1 Tax=Anabrus simplex TaxID=316456 RepID=UPI0035A33C2A